MGQVSDREASWAVGGALIEQQRSDGTWKEIGETDGGGRWWILKDRIKGGGRIRITKPGYFPRTMAEAEFMQETNIMMIPTGAGDRMEDAERQWEGGLESRSSRGS
jgi:hypothetical protein